MPHLFMSQKTKQPVEKGRIARYALSRFEA